MAHMGLTEAEWQVMECLWMSAPRTGTGDHRRAGKNHRLEPQHHPDAAAAAGGQGRGQRRQRGRHEALPAAGSP